MGLRAQNSGDYPAPRVYPCPKGLPLLGGYTLERLLLEIHSPPIPLGSPPRCSGTIRGSRRAFTDFSYFLGRLFLVNSRVVFTVDYLFTCMFFFPEIVLWRNYLINRVALVEEKSILVFPECLEASE